LYGKETKNLYICCNAEKSAACLLCRTANKLRKNKRKYCKTIKIDWQKHKNRVNIAANLLKL
jgi:hypothetical protein